MAALNTANFTSWATGLSASGWQSFADDLTSNWMDAWTSRFDLSSRWQTAMGAISTNNKQELIQNVTKMAAAITAGLATSGMGLFLDDNPSAGSVDNIIFRVQGEYILTKKPTVGIVTDAFTIVVVVIILNGRST